LLGHTSPVKKSGQSRASQKKGPEAARYHPYQQTFNKNEQREVTTSYGAQWNFFEGKVYFSSLLPFCVMKKP